MVLREFNYTYIRLLNNVNVVDMELAGDDNDIHILNTSSHGGHSDCD